LPETAAQIVAARIEHHAGPMRLAAILVVAASTIGTVLARATGELLRGRRHSQIRQEREHLGDLLHVDVKKLGRVPDGGGWRLHGRREKVRGNGNSCDYGTSPLMTTPGWPRSRCCPTSAPPPTPGS
jgi:hypothetical protein